MIYIIAGAPRVGKSIIAKQLAEKIGAPLVVTDDLPEPPNNLPNLSFSGDPKENTLSPEQRTELQVKHSEALRPVVEEKIKAALGNNSDLIIEGVHILPTHVLEYYTKYGNHNFKTYFIGSLDFDLVMHGIFNNTSPTNWLKEASDEVCKQVAEFTVAFSRYIIKEVKAANLVYLERTNRFVDDINLVMSLVK